MTESQTQTKLLFDSIQYVDDKSLGIFIDNLKLEQSIYVITEALNYCHRGGLFSLHESEIISKSLRILNNSDSNKKTEEQ